jgi:hypothetical protein
MEWSSAISERKGTPARCPFATVESCPRYYQIALATFTESIQKLVSLFYRSTPTSESQPAQVFKEEGPRDINIQQNSQGPNGPNTTVIGDNNEVTINPDPTKPVITYFYNGMQRISRPGQITTSSNNPAAKAFRAIREASQKHEWNSLLKLTTDAIIKFHII